VEGDSLDQSFEEFGHTVYSTTSAGPEWRRLLVARASEDLTGRRQRFRMPTEGRSWAWKRRRWAANRALGNVLGVI
jgi:hypothetical protein